MDSWKEPIYRHEEKKKRPVSTDFKCVGQGKQCAWPEKLKSVMHRLNSILSHEKRIKSFGAGWKTRCVRIVCDWQRHWHTKYHSARKIISRLNHTTGCLSGAGVRHSDMTSDLSTATHKMLKTGWRENVREGSEERERGLSRLGKGEKVHKDWIIKWGWGGGEEEDGERLVPVVGPFGPLMCRVTASLTEEWWENGPSCRVALEVMYSCEDGARR